MPSERSSKVQPRKPSSRGYLENERLCIGGDPLKILCAPRGFCYSTLTIDEPAVAPRRRPFEPFDSSLLRDANILRVPLSARGRSSNASRSVKLRRHSMQEPAPSHRCDGCKPHWGGQRNGLASAARPGRLRMLSSLSSRNGDYNSINNSRSS